MEKRHVETERDKLRKRYSQEPAPNRCSGCGLLSTHSNIPVCTWTPTPAMLLDRQIKRKIPDWCPRAPNRAIDEPKEQQHEE